MAKKRRISTCHVRDDRDQDTCGNARCRGVTEVVYLGKPLCWRCWTRLCEQQEKHDEMDR